MDDTIPYHIPDSFRVGSTVRVARAVPQAHAWHEEWTDAAQELVGKTGKIIASDAIRGLRVEKRGVARAWFPSAALELPSKSGPIIIEVPAWGGLS